MGPKEELDVSPFDRQGFLNLVPSIVEACLPPPWVEREVSAPELLSGIEEIVLRLQQRAAIEGEAPAGEVARKILRRMEQEGMLRVCSDGCALPLCFATSLYAGLLLGTMAEAHEGERIDVVLERFLAQQFPGLRNCGEEMEGIRRWFETLIIYLKKKGIIKEAPIVLERDGEGGASSNEARILQCTPWWKDDSKDK